jgi:hypothetical protein
VSNDENMPDPELSHEQQKLVSKLSDANIKLIDQALLNNSCKFWRKVAMIVGTTMSELSNKVEGIPDVYYSSRIRLLVENGKLESQGDLYRMRFSEVKIPDEVTENV